MRTAFVLWLNRDATAAGNAEYGVLAEDLACNRPDGGLCDCSPDPFLDGVANGYG